MLIVREPRPMEVRRILVPVNGHEHSMAAADVAAYVAKASNAEIVLFTVVHSKFDATVLARTGTPASACIRLSLAA